MAPIDTFETTILPPVMVFSPATEILPDRLDVSSDAPTTRASPRSNPLVSLDPVDAPDSADEPLRFAVAVDVPIDAPEMRSPSTSESAPVDSLCPVELPVNLDVARKTADVEDEQSDCPPSRAVARTVALLVELPEVDPDRLLSDASETSSVPDVELEHADAPDNGARPRMVADAADVPLVAPPRMHVARSVLPAIDEHVEAP